MPLSPPFPFKISNNFGYPLSTKIRLPWSPIKASSAAVDLAFSYSVALKSLILDVYGSFPQIGPLDLLVISQCLALSLKHDPSRL